jgi:hypothetical protein
MTLRFPMNLKDSAFCFLAKYNDLRKSHWWQCERTDARDARKPAVIAIFMDITLELCYYIGNGV